MSHGAEYMPVVRAARMLGISDATLRRRIRRGLLPVYGDPLDSRLRLLRVSDIEDFVSTRRLLPTTDDGAE